MTPRLEQFEGLRILAELPDGLALYSTAPRACPVCGKLSFFFRRRDARTRCALCDIRYYESGRQPEIFTQETSAT